ncbi:Gnl3 [Symbiodinium natans]|uniref:Gnl3 protein n=1 Tax=Symbiodinium natans TaxID=878477 RepID=A0A812Q306_9DINO|nr:Gnl3 [Symbiodinium natans]
MKLLGNRKSKKQKLSLKYNIQKRIREHKRRVKKEAKKLGLKKRVRKDPGIPNTLPWKAELLADIEAKKAKREEELAKKKQEAKNKVKQDRLDQQKQSQEMQQQKDVERRKKRAEQVLMSQLEALRKLLLKADVLLQTLDARDPLYCRCPELEAWVRETGKRLVYVLTKVDLILPQQAADWMQVLGPLGPVVCVQVEAGGEGVAQLVQMLGFGPGAKEEPTQQVGILGYEGTGKKSLLKALRREAPGSTRWLLESVGRLRPADDPEGEAAAAAMLHMATRGLLARGRASEGPSAEPLDVVRHLLNRAGVPVVMRRYRLPAFDGAEGFLQVWAKTYNIKTKKGKAPGVESAAQLFLQQLAVAPCCSCLPPAQLADAQPSLWTAHSSRPSMEAVMKTQLGLLRSRDGSSSSAARGLSLPSQGLGPGVALKELMEDDGASEDDDMQDGGEEGEEEEWMEGDEEEDLEDDAMEDD